MRCFSFVSSQGPGDGWHMYHRTSRNSSCKRNDGMIWFCIWQSALLIVDVFENLSETARPPEKMQNRTENGYLAAWICELSLGCSRPSWRRKRRRERVDGRIWTWMYGIGSMSNCYYSVDEWLLLGRFISAHSKWYTHTLDLHKTRIHCVYVFCVRMHSNNRLWVASERVISLKISNR